MTNFVRRSNWLGGFKRKICVQNFRLTCFSIKYGKTHRKDMETEQESISALFFNLSKECQISSVLAPKGGSIITTSFSQLIRKF